MRTSRAAAVRATITIVLLFAIAGCEEPTCGYFRIERGGRCVCRDGTVEGDAGACIAIDGGTPTIECPGGAPSTTIFEDSDGDGHGRIGSGRPGCAGTGGTSTTEDDCDDACAECYPGRLEICDGRDNDCTAGPDDPFACVQGTATACTTTCGTTGTATCSAECTLAIDTSCTPPTETCNDADDDCDGVVDQGALSFRGPIEWPRVGLRQAALERTTGGFILTFVSASEDAIFAQRLDPSAARLGEPIMLAAGATGVVDSASLDGGGVAIAFELDDALYETELDAEANVVVAARRIASGSIDSIQIETLGAFIVVAYEIDRAIFTARFAPGGDAPRPSAMLASGESIAMRAIEGARAYLAYVHVPPVAAGDPSTDDELFVIALDGLGWAVGAPYRVTDNDLADRSPTIATDGGLLAIAWTESPDTTSIHGRARIEVLEPVPGGAWVRRGPAAVTLGDVSTLVSQSVRLARTSQGWALSLLTVGASPFETLARVSFAAPDLSWTQLHVPFDDDTTDTLDFVVAILDGNASAGPIVGRLRGNTATRSTVTEAFEIGCF
jgi:hypothetical protein